MGFNKSRRKIMKSRTVAPALLSVAGLLLAATFVPASFAQSQSQDQSAPPATAQQAPDERKHGDGKFAGLNLTDDQKSQMKQIRQDAKAKTDAVRADNSLSDTDKEAKLKAIHRAAKKQMRGVLTPEQRRQLRAQVKTRARERRAAATPSASM
jgi:Spy/CpxP family protein refolding chaperone